ncbi:hypothetical protein ASPCAL14115 [Aspergillus calidoustus]|uniref:F-box domain-containing protein n=1 Tax=Aspergillus calidoustus TaxID=454130 RepID=A0A0U5GH28_ASPCI|nr:hypothetical protein ASPCAL14115 [Aspergillus calidoustus]
MIPLKRKLHAGHGIIQYLTKRIKGHRPEEHPGISHAGLFEKLPPELIELIANSSDARGVCALRLTCTYINNSTLHTFESNYSVQTIRTDFSKDSFKRLTDLCKMRHLAVKVETVHVTGRVNFSYLGKGFKWKHTDGDEMTLIDDQSAVTEWCALFLQLVNCGNFIISGFGQNAANIDLLSKGDALMLLFYIIGAVDIPVKSFRVEGTDSRDLQRTGYFEKPRFRNAWATVESLEFHRVDPSRPVYAFFAPLVAYATSLKRLKIDDYLDVHTMNFIGRATLTLQELHLTQRWNIAGRLPAQCWTAWDLEGRAGYLRKLHILRLAMEGGASWIPFLSSLRQHHTSLEEITISGFYTGGTVKRWLHFPAIAVDPVVDPATGSEFQYRCWSEGWGPGRPLCMYVKYAGPRMGIALQRLEATAQEG